MPARYTRGDWGQTGAVQKDAPGISDTGRRPAGERRGCYIAGYAVGRGPQRIRGLDEQVALLQAQLELEQERNVGLEEVCRTERGERDRMRRMASILGLSPPGCSGCRSSAFSRRGFC